MKKHIKILLSLALISCSSTKIETIRSQECNSVVKIIKYNKSFLTFKNEGKKTKKGNHFYIYFTEYYENDEVKAYINGKLLFDDILTTDESLGTTEKGFHYEYKNCKTPIILKVTKNGNDNCFDVVLDRKFNQLFIYSNNGKWKVIYDNIYPFYE